MATKRQFYIARDGWLPSLLCVLATVSASVYLNPWFALGPLALMGWLLLFYRNPNRPIPAIPQAVVSPLDGKVESVDKLPCPYLECEEGYRLHFARSYLTPYYIRSPIEGRVMELGPEFRPENGLAWRLDNDEGDQIVIIMKGDHPLSDRAFRPRYGERAGQGQRCGTRRLGSELTLWLPLNARLMVEAGQDVRAGSDVLAKLVHK